MVRAIYDRIYKDIRHAIERGDYPYQSLLPSEAVLVKRYECSHNTLRRALAILAEEGFVQPIHGKGVLVLYRPRERALFEIGGIETFKEAARRNRLHTTTTVTHYEPLTCDAELSSVSGFAKGTDLFYVERVRSLDGKPVILDKNYFLATAVSGLTSEIASHSVYEYLERELGMCITTSKRTITVEHADPNDEHLLDIAGVDYLAVVTSQTFNEEGTMFEYTQSRHHPDYFCFYDTATRRR